jgi:hypothetical protein
MGNLFLIIFTFFSSSFAAFSRQSLIHQTGLLSLDASNDDMRGILRDNLVVVEHLEF